MISVTPACLMLKNDDKVHFGFAEMYDFALIQKIIGYDMLFFFQFLSIINKNTKCRGH